VTRRKSVDRISTCVLSSWTEFFADHLNLPARNSGLEPIGSYTDANGVVYMRPDVSWIIFVLAFLTADLVVLPQFSYRARSHSRSISRPRPPGAGPSTSRPISLISTDPPLTVKQTASLALLFCGLWFSANWSMNAALGYTSVSSTTILSSMSGELLSCCF
jgi:solute carrier family 35, member F5